MLNLDFNALQQSGTNPYDDIRSLVELSPKYKNRFTVHILTVLRLRLAMMLLPTLVENMSHNGMRKITISYIENLGFKFGKDFEEEEVDRILEAIAFVRQAERGDPKPSWAKLHYKDKNELLTKHNGRCGVCGIQFRLGAGFSCMESPELDHIIPFALGGNKHSNLRLICKRCNTSKSNNISFINSDVVSLNYFIKRLHNEEQHDVKFWVFERDHSTCTNQPCSNSSLTMRLEVIKDNNWGRFIYDNLRTVCEKCWLHLCSDK